MSEVLRTQIQHEAVQEAYQHRYILKGLKYIAHIDQEEVFIDSITLFFYLFETSPYIISELFVHFIISLL